VDLRLGERGALERHRARRRRDVALASGPTFGVPGHHTYVSCRQSARRLFAGNPARDPTSRLLTSWKRFAQLRLSGPISNLSAPGGFEITERIIGYPAGLVPGAAEPAS